MVNIISMQAENRRRKTSVIIKSIKESFNAGRDVDYEKLLNVCCMEFGASRRHVMELIETSLPQFNYEIIKKNNRRIIKDTSNAETNPERDDSGA